MSAVFSTISLLDPVDYTDEANLLYTRGYVVVPLFTPAEIKQLRTEFDATLAALPEFLPGATQYSKTGFGALGTASSFHNPFVRKLRLYLYNALSPLFQAYDGLSGNAPRNFHMLLDRMCVRLESQAPTAEAWHQDKSPHVEGDDIIGGWFSISDNDQFSCVPGTQNIVTNNAGFALLEPGTELFDRCNRDKRTVPVPAGSILLFHQHLIHEVAPSKGRLVKRVFLNWRLTYSDEDLNSRASKNSNSRQDGRGDSQNLFEVLEQQAVPKIASGQLPSMWNVRSVDTPKQHAGLNAWITANIQPHLLQDKHPDSFSKKRGADGNFLPKYPYPVIPLHCPSLAQQGRKYPDYAQEEIDILVPRPF